MINTYADFTRCVWEESLFLFGVRLLLEQKKDVIRLRGLGIIHLLSCGHMVLAYSGYTWRHSCAFGVRSDGDLVGQFVSRWRLRNFSDGYPLL